MTKTYTITLSEAEDKALGVVALSQEEWITNAIKVRCELAMEDIVKAEVERKFAAGEPIVGTKEDIVLAADVESAFDRNARLEAESAARLTAANQA